ncbi:MAG: hypothetical protein U0900_05990 [Myxococcota bacterium]
MGLKGSSSNRRAGRVVPVVALVGAIGFWAAGCGDSGTGGKDSTASAPSAGSATNGLLIAPPLAADAPLATALAHPDPLERTKRVAAILEASGPEDLRELTAAFEAAPLPWGDLDYSLFAGWWARFDPIAAMSYCHDDEIRMRHPSAPREVMRMWARMDPQAVITSGWLNSVSLEMAGLNPEYVDPFVIGWFESGRPGLVEWIQGVDGSSKPMAMASYMRMLVVRDGSAKALEWARTAPVDPATQRLFLATGLNVVSRQDPKIAIEWLDIAEKDGIDVRTFVARIGRGWATHDPKAAMEWVTSRDVDPNERWRVVHDIADVWLHKDEAAVTEWLKGREHEEWTDQIRRQWIFQHVKKNRYKVDWLDLMERAGRFVNADSQRAERLWIFQRWNVVDPAPAAAWLEKNEALLGDKLQYAHQLYTDDRKEIEKILAEDKAAREGTAPPSAETPPAEPAKAG